MIHRSTKFKNEDECKQEHNCKNKLDDEIKQDIINEKKSSHVQECSYSEGYRIEKDSLGEKQIPSSAYYGIHTARAIENFDVSGRTVNLNLIHAIVLIKKAAAMTNKKINQLQTEKADVIIRACDEILRGNFNEYFVVDPFQGGAGTSTNMNVNEVVANRAIELLGGEKGDYDLIHPLNHVNHFQSTNDVYPTALRIASINLLRKLSSAFASLQEALQKKGK